MDAIDPQLQLTSRALRAAKAEIAADACLRVAFAGGCGAFGFRVSTSRRQLPGDRLVDIDGLHVYLDARALRELAGATIDFDPNNGFLIDHPLAGATC